MNQVMDTFSGGINKIYNWLGSIVMDTKKNRWNCAY